jgi:hypothetical protein
MDPHRCVEFYSGHRRLHAGESRPDHSGLGRRARDVHGRASCELLSCELHTRAQQVRQVKAEVFLAADRAFGPHGGWCGGADANGKIRCRSLLIFLFFRETVYANKGEKACGSVCSPASHVRTNRRRTNARGGALALSKSS